MPQTKIIRRPDRAEGGITPEEKAQMDDLAQHYINEIILRTSPADINKLAPAIRSLYRAADLDDGVNVVLVSSPVQMAMVYGAASWIWHCRGSDATDAATSDATLTATRAATDDATSAATDDATFDATFDATLDATDAATDDATYAATYAATRIATRDAARDATSDATFTATRAATDIAAYAATLDATFTATRAATDIAAYAATVAATDTATLAATYAATYDATDAATRDATYAATRDATLDATDDICGMYAKIILSLSGRGGLECAKWWSRAYQGGAMWAQWDCYAAAARDVLGLKLEPHKAYSSWEACLEGGFRCMHEKFCVISDHPAFIKQDDRHLPHCEDGPSHLWRDGWALYHWHGIAVPKEWIVGDGPTIEDALHHENVEKRRAACEIIGWDKIMDRLNARTIDKHKNPQVGELVEVDIPDVGRERFLRVMCGTDRAFALPVPPDTKDALSAQAWLKPGADIKNFKLPAMRT